MIYENLEKHIKKYQRAVMDVSSTCVKKDKPIFVDTLSKSRFRKKHFAFKSDGPIKMFAEKANTKVQFAELCKLLRDYISTNSLYLDNGWISCDDFLKNFTGKETVSFVWLVSQFRLILE